MSFDVLAPYYRWMEFILAGEKLHRCRTAFLDELPRVRNILLLGEGHGRALIECARRFDTAHITCLDASARMLEVARNSLIRHSLSRAKVEFVQADILHWSADSNAYDLIIANFLLDCFPPDQLETVILNIAMASTPDSNLLVADFKTAEQGIARIRSRLILWTMYVFFRTVTRLPARTLSVPDPYLERAGFALHRRKERDWGLLHSDWWCRRP